MTAAEDSAAAMPEAAVAEEGKLHRGQLFLSLIVTLILSFFLYKRVDVHAFSNGLARASDWLLIPALVLLTLGWVCRAMRWRVLLTRYCSISPTGVFRLVMIGAMLSAVIPARAGEFWRAHALGREKGLSRSTAFGTIVVERVLDGLVLAILASVAALAVGPSTSMTLLIASMLALFGFSLGLVALLGRSARARTGIIVAARALSPRRYRHLVEEKLELFVNGLGVLQDARVLFSAILLSLLIYCVDSAGYWTAGVAFGLSVKLPSYLLVVAVGNLAIALPLSLGGIGPFEFFVQQALTLMGTSGSLALAYAVFVHGLTLALVVVVGVLLLVWSRIPGLSLRRKGRPVLAAQDPG